MARNRETDFADALLEGMFAAAVIGTALTTPRTRVRYVPVRERPRVRVVEVPVVREELEFIDVMDVSDRPDLDDRSCGDCRHRRFGGTCPILNRHRYMSDPACRHFR